MFEGSFKEVSWVFQLRLKGVSRGFKGVSRVFESSLRGVLGKFQGSFKDVSREFQRSSKGGFFILTLLEIRLRVDKNKNKLGLN